MGANQSMDLNITMMASIIQCNLTDIENILLHIEGKPKKKSQLEKYCEVWKKERALETQQKQREKDEYRQQVASGGSGPPTVADINNSQPQTPRKPVPNHSQAMSPEKGSPFALGKDELPTYERAVYIEKIDASLYLMKPEELEDLLTELRFSASDIDILTNLYTLIDRRGFEDLDTRVVLIAFSMLLAHSAKEFVRITFQLFDRTSSGLIEKKDLLDIASLANDTLLFFGDKNLKSMQVVDFADSVFTAAGKIDGEIAYMDYVDTMTDHPIVEMLLSPQFQGNIRSKLKDEASLAALDMSV
jgi:Ca2+-binding EF-hand superfamily protein